MRLGRQPRHGLRIGIGRTSQEEPLGNAAIGTLKVQAVGRAPHDGKSRERQGLFSGLEALGFGASLSMDTPVARGVGIEPIRRRFANGDRAKGVANRRHCRVFVIL